MKVEKIDIDQYDKMDVDNDLSIRDEVLPEHIRTFAGHQNEIFVCSWHPQENIVATGYLILI